MCVLFLPHIHITIVVIILEPLPYTLAGQSSVPPAVFSGTFDEECNGILVYFAAQIKLAIVQKKKKA